MLYRSIVRGIRGALRSRKPFRTSTFFFPTSRSIQPAALCIRSWASFASRSSVHMSKVSSNTPPRISVRLLTTAIRRSHSSSRLTSCMRSSCRASVSSSSCAYAPRMSGADKSTRFQLFTRPSSASCRYVSTTGRSAADCFCLMLPSQAETSTTESSRSLRVLPRRACCSCCFTAWRPKSAKYKRLRNLSSLYGDEASERTASRRSGAQPSRSCWWSL
mmetsp:Transcript_72961/g.84649  ORF Transcript_72961/g.84649 Transcript_72961/m.84649 type:complete len:218 (+) Transcript_72961:245-898(+)